MGECGGIFPTTFEDMKMLKTKVQFNKEQCVLVIEQYIIDNHINVSFKCLIDKTNKVVTVTENDEIKLMNNLMKKIMHGKVKWVRE